MIEITTQKAKILIVDLPEGAHSVTLEYNKQHNYYSLQYKLPNETGFTCSGSYVFLVKDFGKRKDYPKEGELKILGPTFGLTEEQWRKIVEYEELYINGNGQGIRYRDYKLKGRLSQDVCEWYGAAIYSGLSLLAANKVYKDNPHSKFECPNQWCDNGYIDQGYNEKWRCDFCQENEDLEEEAQSKLLSNPITLIKI